MRNPDQLLQYIEDAKTWLDKAETEFNNANSVRGELILSLAQAEVKHAWELSRGQSVSSDQKKVPGRKMSWIIPMAAGLSILFIGGGVFFTARVWQSGSVPKGNPMADLKQPVSQTVPVTAKNLPVQNSPALNKMTVRKSVLKPVLTPALVEAAQEKAPVSEPVVTEPPAIGKNNASDSKQDKVIAEAGKPRAEEKVRPEPTVQEVSAVQDRSKPALQLPVEDDLTNMATHSLKNGR